MRYIDFDNTLLSMLSLPLCPILIACVWPGFEVEEYALTQSMVKINMVYPRKFLLTESWVAAGFLLVFFFFVFHIDHF